jgi:hypothetical protein
MKDKIIPNISNVFLRSLVSKLNVTFLSRTYFCWVRDRVARSDSISILSTKKQKFISFQAVSANFCEKMMDPAPPSTVGISRMGKIMSFKEKLMRMILHVIMFYFFSYFSLGAIKRDNFML